MIEPPAALQKIGIREAVTNRRPDQTVTLPPKLIVTLFGEELLRRIAAARKENPHAG